MHLLKFLPLTIILKMHRRSARHTDVNRNHVALYGNILSMGEKKAAGKINTILGDLRKVLPDSGICNNSERERVNNFLPKLIALKEEFDSSVLRRSLN